MSWCGEEDTFRLRCFFCVIYVDNGAFAFVSRQDLEIGAYLLFKQFERLGLEMHVGNADKASKTECVFFPLNGKTDRKSVLPFSGVH